MQLVFSRNVFWKDFWEISANFCVLIIWTKELCVVKTHTDKDLTAFLARLHKKNYFLCDCESILLRPTFTFLVWQQPLVAVVIIMAVKETVN